jgi:hypothetical protein
MVSNWQAMSLLIVMIYCLSDPSILTCPLLCIIILKGYTEYSNLQLKFWSLVYKYLFAIVIVKALCQGLFNWNTDPNNTNNDSTPATNSKLLDPGATGLAALEWIIGDLGYNFGNLCSLIAVLISALSCQFNGLSQKCFEDYENVYDAYGRIVANEKKKEITEHFEDLEYLKLLNSLKPYFNKTSDS